MRCIKTGCDVFVVNTGEYIHGDAYQTESGDLVIRTSGTAYSPMSDRRHFSVMDYDHWFDERADRVGTMFVNKGMYNDHGYEGIEEPGKRASAA